LEILRFLRTILWLLGGRDETGMKIRTAMETAGIVFIDENGGGPGVRLRKQHQKKS
jgi:hypothetical protein